MSLKDLLESGAERNRSGQTGRPERDSQRGIGKPQTCSARTTSRRIFKPQRGSIRFANRLVYLMVLGKDRVYKVFPVRRTQAV